MEGRKDGSIGWAYGGRMDLTLTLTLTLTLVDRSIGRLDGRRYLRAADRLAKAVMLSRNVCRT
eukprot:scaffold14009_cov61-Phaeocystis_antarctica.AAC.2